ncbi:hypothetical protein GCM10010275_30320 [Streptomyces litmocidini]|nr:hypothetical protein GCM10010275_30320 [Streptomyces litmocidini]
MTGKTCEQCTIQIPAHQRLRRKMCNRCYCAWVANPSNASKVRRLNRPILERVNERTAAQSNGCIHWTGSLNEHGYGRISIKKEMHLAHRVVYQEVVGPLPDGVMLDHTCHNLDESCGGGSGCLHRRCVNPAHLEPVTNVENQERSKNTHAGRRILMDTCIRGHRYTPETTYIDANGHRSCRTCARLLHEAALRDKPPAVIRKFCKNGHAMTAENTRIRGRYVCCKLCEAARARRMRARQKEQA